MAATGTPTPNIGLRIPQGTDPASVDDINYNSNLLDTKLGAVGDTSVQDQIDSLNSKTPTIKVITDTVTVNTTDGSADLSDAFITTSCTCFVQILRSNSTTWVGITVSNRIITDGSVSLTFRNADGTAVARGTSIRVALLVTK